MQPADNQLGFGILIRNTPLGQYGICYTGPQPNDCGTFAFTEPDANGFRISAIACVPRDGAQPGAPAEYAVTWFLGGNILPVPITFTSALSSFGLVCQSQP